MHTQKRWWQGLECSGWLCWNNAMVSLADSLAVLKVLPGTERKLIFRLAPWGGLRTMSEQRGLKWGDVDWEKKRFLVHSPKTERHDGRACR